MEQDNFYTIGSRQEVMGGTRFTSGKTFNGYCYKDQKAFATHKGICYITESAFDEDNSVVITPDKAVEMVEEGKICTFESMFNEVFNLCHSLHLLDKIEFPQAYKFVEHIATNVFEVIDWQCSQSYLYELEDLEEELKIWLEKQDKNKK